MIRQENESRPVCVVEPNPSLSGMQCVKCQRTWPIGDYFYGCPACAAAGAPASVAPIFESFLELRGAGEIATWLAYPGHPRLGEGNTPLLELTETAAKNKVRWLGIKNEGANPTGSHKDRMSAAVVRRALDIGARTLAVASSGNAGASLAAYAAHAGLKCVVVTTAAMASGWRKAIELHGAEVIVAPNSAARWELVSVHAKSGEWYPASNFTIPAVGSNLFAVDGYRAIALELFLALGAEQPSDIIVPVSRGDLLWGLTKGYADLFGAGLVRDIPRIHAAEPFPRIARVMAGEDYVGQFDGQSPFLSLGGTTVTYQAIAALLSSRGAVAGPSADQTIAAQRELAQAGLFVESSSAIALAGLKILREQSVITQDASVVLILTSHGYKES
ncbi:pyridoxal-phosphate dependent enzyme [Neorhizobium galegae]|uniref:threonine synthase n=1 Tax=Neorhizobium galegae TaxID=399 RepID=UPI00062102D4|nr:pyridoxal-phosphate dependent enzyme [Neorhizobium galegae]CDZ29937.1 Threonine synthase [Neorhizobium galegae bv. officinalis]KAA9383798.1 pyridoxal-phosphate dependent enzyme [Neorhizobium galegae]MCM2500069.1 pyridoxal-phosphate dependent enzyme [Neorhizobium galegae]MCQ1768152.1 pyridoxal-phosphate dependent enzyme [Neorhizobium galegae]MCQ1775273.1 pyridoxal-phosphate dependent enzyme [Neorhizobium galegae]